MTAIDQALLIALSLACCVFIAILLCLVLKGCDDDV
jgi:hypothetical protein